MKNSHLKKTSTLLIISFIAIFILSGCGHPHRRHKPKPKPRRVSLEHQHAGFKHIPYYMTTLHRTS